MGNKYENYTDEELIDQLRAGEKEIMDYLIDKYRNLVRRHANQIFLLGGDSDDVIQEGTIGLFKAIRDFDAGKDSSFYHFADMCIARQIYTAVEAASRKKHGPLNSYVSLDGEADTGENETAEAFRVEAHSNPEDLIIAQENVRAMFRKVQDNLSKMENQVLALCMDGYNYRQIADQLGKSEKSIDNALQRIRSKISKLDLQA